MSTVREAGAPAGARTTGAGRRRRACLPPLLAALTAPLALVADLGLAAPAAPAVPEPVLSGRVPDAAPPPAAPVAPVQRPPLGISVATAADLARFVEVTGTRPEVVDVVEPWSAGRSLPRDPADAALALGARPSVTWEPRDPALDTADQPGFALSTVVAGARRLRRPLRAVSGRSRCAGHHLADARDERQLVPVRSRRRRQRRGRVRGRLTARARPVHGAGRPRRHLDVGPNAACTGSAPLAPLFPGDGLVDAVGVSNYDWGERSHDGFATSWRPFGSLSTRPVWIAEVASSNSGGRKAAWLGGVLAELQARPAVAGLVWFGQVDDRHGVDWRIEIEPDTAPAWVSGSRARHLSTENGEPPS